MGVTLAHWKRTKFDHVTLFEIPVTAPKVRDIFNIFGTEVGNVHNPSHPELDTWTIQVPDDKIEKILDILRKLRASGIRLDEPEPVLPPVNGVDSNDLGGTLEDNSEADEDMPPMPENVS